jgi:hypothetical protein
MYQLGGEKFPNGSVCQAVLPRIRQTLVGFDLRGTGLEGKLFGADVAKLVPVNYKQDWANARHIDQLAAQSRKGGSS